MDINNILYRDGLSVEILQSLSYESKIGINLKKNLHYFNQQVLFKELESIESWYDSIIDIIQTIKLEKFLMIYLVFDHCVMNMIRFCN